MPYLELNSLKALCSEAQEYTLFLGKESSEDFLLLLLLLGHPGVRGNHYELQEKEE